MYDNTPNRRVSKRGIRTNEASVSLIPAIAASVLTFGAVLDVLAVGALHERGQLLPTLLQEGKRGL